MVLYSHDTMGIGHARRNVLIAQALARNLAPTTVLMIAGAREMAGFPLPAGVDLLTLPALHKEMDGSYRPRQLHVTLSDLIAVRAGALRAAVAAFQPDVLLVDKEPRGALGELGPTLERFEAAAGDLLDELGYPRGCPHLSQERRAHRANVRAAFVEDALQRNWQLPQEWSSR